MRITSLPRLQSTMNNGEPDVVGLYEIGACNEAGTDCKLFDPGAPRDKPGRPPTADPVVRFPARARLAAARYCAACPVRPDCFEHARRRGDVYGVWGGYWFRPRGQSVQESVYYPILEEEEKEAS